ncbi:alpha-1D adrenergic receptor [Asbolus verrucosus]|uniref:Alpha-1D adrenergic receptor n=1 Tax=Asbolus verrucosus TaxID=1661398 RepID=A0A482W8L8_ASBVE|nr:alpha-1D adrenergic receptor [Asbolus verrucosus]
MESDGHWLISAGLVTSSIIAIAANAFLLLIFCRRRGLRTVPNRFVINLLMTNLLSSLLLIPLLIVDQSSPTSPAVNSTISSNESVVFVQEELIEKTNSTTNVEYFEESVSTVTYINATVTPPSPDRIILCYAAQVSTSFVCTVSILSILLIGVNQYFGVIHSLRYHFYINNCRSIVFIITTWLVALLFSVLSTSTDSDSSLWRFCRDRPETSRTVAILNTVYAVTYCAAVILAPFVAICVIYVCIYTAAHKNSERMRKSTRTNLNEERPTLPKVRSAPNFMRFEESVASAGRKVTRTCSERTANNFITSLKHKISNASVFKYREETRAAKISVLVIFLVLFCYLPYGVTLVLNSGLVGLRTSPICNFVSLLLLAMSNVISPFLFGYRNKRVKREIGKVFGLVPPKNPDLSILNRRRSTNDDQLTTKEPFLGQNCTVPEVIVTCKVDGDRKSILKRVCQSSNWTSYKKCNFITVPESCISGEARGSFSSASTQISNEDC